MKPQAGLGGPDHRGNEATLVNLTQKSRASVLTATRKHSNEQQHALPGPELHSASAHWESALGPPPDLHGPQRNGEQSPLPRCGKAGTPARFESCRGYRQKNEHRERRHRNSFSRLTSRLLQTPVTQDRSQSAHRIPVSAETSRAVIARHLTHHLILATDQRINFIKVKISVC